MKHPIHPTIILIGLFFLTQILGISMLATQLETSTNEDGAVVVEYSEPVTGPRPELEGRQTLTYFILAIGLGTGVLLLLIKLGARKIWKVWYVLAITLASAVSIGTITPTSIAYILAGTLAYLRVTKKHSIVNNISEVLVHIGLALIFVPLLEILYAILLLIVIAAYDAYAVWKSKHMVTMATFMTQEQLFAGVQVGYTPQKKATTAHTEKKQTTTKKKTAILGGGDLSFPLLFSGAAQQWLVGMGINVFSATLLTGIITLTATASLALLFWISKKDKFYPAMPFLSSGCLVGLGIIALIT